MRSKGCSSSRGASDIRHMSSQGGGLAKQSNRLYMLNVRRDSMMTKKSTLQNQLSQIIERLKGLDADIRSSEKEYKKLRSKGKNKIISSDTDYEKTMPINF
jgi:hypothetical protein